jgi:hypothetical protein
MQAASPNKALALPREDRSEAVSVGFSILGVGIRLEGNPGADIYPAARLYADFLNDKTAASWTIVWNGRASPTRLTVNGKVHPALSRKWISALISMKIMDCLYRSSEDFYLFHGAAAARRGVLLVFPGQSGTGKSLLAIVLARSGWTLFSDEIIAISKTSLRVFPFGRAIMVRKSEPLIGDLLLGAEDKSETMPLVGGGAKTMIPFSFFNEPPTPLPFKAIVCLRGGRREVSRGGRQVVVTHWDEKMEKLAKQRGLYGSLRVSRVGEFWCITGDRTAAAEDICTSLGGIVIERDLIEEDCPLFARRPLLKTISPSECLNALWSVFQNGRAHREREGGTVGLYMHLARLVKAIPSFWLRPGALSPTCELLQNLADRLTNNDASRE